MNTNGWNEERGMSTKTGQMIARTDVGIGMKKQHVVMVVMARAGEHQGEWKVMETAGGMSGYPISTTYFATESEAISYAEILLVKVPEKYYSVDAVILEKGTKMASKYNGKDIYGQQFTAGTYIIYYKGEMILQ